MPKKRDTKAPEDFAKIEDKFKLSLLNMEKRFVDLEMTVSSLTERLKSGQVESVQAVNQRLEDIEDLIMIEQAGLMELKNVMERAENKFQTVIGFDEKVEKKLEGKIASVEHLAKNAAEKEDQIKLKSELNKKISRVEREIADIRSTPTIESVSPLEVGELRNKLQDLEKRVSAFIRTTGDLKKSVEERVKSAVKDVQLGTAGFEFMNSKLESLKAGIDVLNDKRVGMDMKMDGLEEKIGSLEKRERDSLPDKLLDEVKISKRGLNTNNVKIESLERVVRELTANMQGIESKAKRFESLERLTNLKKEVDEKLRRFKFLEEEMSKLSSRVEIMYNSLDKRLMVIKNQEKDIKRLSQSMTEFVKDLEHVRIDMNARVEKKDVGKILQGVEKKVGSAEDIDKIVKSMSEELDGVKKSLSELKRGVREVGKEELPGGFKVVVNDLGMRMSELEKVLEMIQSSVGELAQRVQEPSMYDMRLKEIVDKFVFLETRLAAMESMLQKTRPIILE